jgi:ABC-type glycerol-3-phosphate transport system substrate-binding protein
MFENLKLSFSQNKLFWIGGILAAIMVIILIVVSIANGQKTAKPVATANPQVELTWWKTEEFADKYDEIIQAFNATAGNTNVRINVVKKELNKDYYKQLIKDMASNIGPDIFSIGNDDLPAYQEFMSPIEIFRGKELADYKQNFASLVVRDTISKDKVYGISSYIDNLQLYYNKTVLTQNQYTSPATTWEEVSKQAPFLNKKPIGTDKFLQSSIALGTGGRSNLGSSNIPLHSDI